jgi:hypothetical protein
MDGVERIFTLSSKLKDTKDGKCEASHARDVSFSRKESLD